jgi:hypothetical protein
MVGPELGAERLDHVVRRNADMRGPVLQHLRRAVENAHDGTDRAVLARGEATQPMKVPEQLVGAVDEVVDDPRPKTLHGRGGPPTLVMGGCNLVLVLCVHEVREGPASPQVALRDHDNSAKAAPGPTPAIRSLHTLRE